MKFLTKISKEEVLVGVGAFVVGTVDGGVFQK